MGATSFDTIAAGRTVADAFAVAVQDAHYWHGHGGYSGTIAEKDGWLEVVCPPRVNPNKVLDTVWRATEERYGNTVGKHRRQLHQWFGQPAAEQLLDAADSKWGPAVALRMPAAAARPHLPKTPTGKCKAGYQAWLFFGLASC